MASTHPPELCRYFDHAIDKIEQHAAYSQNLARAIEAGQPLILNYHTHGPGQGYCASICVNEGEVALLGLRGELRELAHLRGIGQREDECEPLMTVFAARLAERFELAQLPETWLDGQPLAKP
jgi:hypothetical protein